MKGGTHSTSHKTQAMNVTLKETSIPQLCLNMCGKKMRYQPCIAIATVAHVVFQGPHVT